VRTSVVVVLTGALLALPAAPATAESWHGGDAARDARAYDLDLGSECDSITPRSRLPHDRRRDITGLRVDHGEDSVVVAVALRDVARRDAETSYDLALRAPGKTFHVEVFRGRGGRVEVSLSTVHLGHDPDAPACGPVLVANERDCPEAAGEVDPRSNRVTVTLPRQCLGVPAWVQVGATAVGFDPGQLTSSNIITVVADAWGPDDVSTRLLPRFGPRVDAG